MKKYKLYVCMPVAKFKITVKADFYELTKSRIDFYTSKEPKSQYVGWKLIASYPSQYTIIEEIK